MSPFSFTILLRIPTTLLMLMIFTLPPVAAAGDRAVVLVEEWTRTVTSPEGYSDSGNGVAVSPDGASIYVTGSYYISGEGTNIWLRKYDSDGSTLWTEGHTTKGNSPDEGMNVAVSPDGKAIYVAGFISVEGKKSNIWLSRYNTGGDKKWTRIYKGKGGDHDKGLSVAVSPDSRAVYVAGFKTVTGKGQVAWLRKYTRRGDKVWTRTYAPQDGAAFYGVAVGSNGKVYVTGKCHSCSKEGNSAMLLYKYSPAGRKIWGRRVAPDIFENTGMAVAVAPEGDVYVTGSVRRQFEGRDFWIWKYSPKGEVMWTDFYNGSVPVGQDEQGLGLAVDSSGEVLVCGYAQDGVSPGGTDLDHFMRKYTAQGDVVWTAIRNGGYSDVTRGVAVGPDGRPVFTGRVAHETQGNNIWVRKYLELIVP